MTKDNKNKIKVTLIMIAFTILLVYSFYIHKLESHWFESMYVKILK